MIEDLMELLRPHLENPDAERKKQQEEFQAEQEKQEKEKEEKQKRLAEMVKKIKEAAVVMNKILQNHCTITIAKKMHDEKGKEEKVTAIIKLSEKSISMIVSGFSFEDEDRRKCLKTGLNIAMNQGMGIIETGIVESLKDSYIEILYEFLSTDNVKVTYE